MIAISPEEWEVLGFREVQPKLLDKDIPWPYKNFLQKIERGDLSLSCAIAPAYRAVRLILKRGSKKLYELDAPGRASRHEGRAKSGKSIAIVNPTGLEVD